MDAILINNSWLSIENSIEPMQRITSKTRMSANDVLSELIDNRLKASVRITSEPLLVWPMVTLTGDDAAKFRLDEQRIETYRGKSFTYDGGLLAPYRVVTPLTGGHILDLPMTESSRALLQRLRDNPVPVGKRLFLPLGTLLEIPETGDYFVTVDAPNMPDVFCEIVIRTKTLKEFEIQLNALTPAPDIAVMTVAGKKWTPEKLAELKAFRTKNIMAETAVEFEISEQRIRQLLPSDKPKAKPFAGLIHRIR